MAGKGKRRKIKQKVLLRAERLGRFEIMTDIDT
jgi:hypothetical protein